MGKALYYAVVVMSFASLISVLLSIVCGVSITMAMSFVILSNVLRITSLELEIAKIQKSTRRLN